MLLEKVMRKLILWRTGLQGALSAEVGSLRLVVGTLNRALLSGSERTDSGRHFPTISPRLRHRGHGAVRYGGG